MVNYKFIGLAVFCILLFSGVSPAVAEKQPESEAKPASKAAEDPAEVMRRAFAEWKQGFIEEAVRQGIKQEIAEDALKNVQPVQKIIDLDRKQPERTITFSEYLKNVVPVRRVRKGQKLLQENKALLEEIGRKYGVQPRFIVALWGIETDYGGYTGNNYVPEALATLAFDERRREFFTKELVNALLILQEGHVAMRDMQGSWAGAMGQTQFMPSSFVNFAVDYNGDGRKDIWDSKHDIFASIANYLSKTGWDDRTTWGRRVKIPANLDKNLANDKKIKKSLKEWQNLGVRRITGKDLPLRTDIRASLVLPDKDKKAANNQGDSEVYAFLVYDNYRTIMKWNRSYYFATAVGLLSDKFR